MPRVRLRVPSPNTRSASPSRSRSWAISMERLRRARDLARIHHRVLRRHAAALRHLDRAEAQAREAPLETRIDLGAGDDRQPVTGLVGAGAMEHHLEQVGVGVRQVIGDDDDRAAPERREVLCPVQRRFGQQDAIGEHLVDLAGQRVARIVVPVGASRRQRAASDAAARAVRPRRARASGTRESHRACPIRRETS